MVFLNQVVFFTNQYFENGNLQQSKTSKFQLKLLYLTILNTWNRKYHSTESIKFRNTSQK